jgi:hypothetical protein
MKDKLNEPDYVEGLANRNAVVFFIVISSGRQTTNLLTFGAYHQLNLRFCRKQL